MADLYPEFSPSYYDDMEDAWKAWQLSALSRAAEMRDEADRAGDIAARDERVVAGEDTERAAETAANLAKSQLASAAGGGAAAIAGMQAAQQTRDKEFANLLLKARERKDAFEQKEVDRRKNSYNVLMDAISAQQAMIRDRQLREFIQWYNSQSRKMQQEGLDSIVPESVRTDQISKCTTREELSKLIISWGIEDRVKYTAPANKRWDELEGTKEMPGTGGDPLKPAPMPPPMPPPVPAPPPGGSGGSGGSPPAAPPPTDGAPPPAAPPVPPPKPKDGETNPYAPPWEGATESKTGPIADAIKAAQTLEQLDEIMNGLSNEELEEWAEMLTQRHDEIDPSDERLKIYDDQGHNAGVEGDPVKSEAIATEKAANEYSQQGLEGINEALGRRWG